jgi:hypothetical protein
MGDSLKITALGILLFTIPAAFHRLGARWYPDLYGPDSDPDHPNRAHYLRRRFWRAALLVAAVIGLVLVGRFVAGGVALSGSDWLRVLAATVALTAALGRGGWMIQTYHGSSVIERIDRAMYVIGQVGAAALLVLVLTL